MVSNFRKCKTVFRLKHHGVQKNDMYKWHILTVFVINHSIWFIPTSFTGKIKDKYTLLLASKQQSKSKGGAGIFFLHYLQGCQWCELWLQNFYYCDSIINRKNTAVFSDPRWDMSDWHSHPRFSFVKPEQSHEGSAIVAPPNLSFCWVTSSFVTVSSKVFSPSLLLRKNKCNAILFRKKSPEFIIFREYHE